MSRKQIQEKLNSALDSLVRALKRKKRINHVSEADLSEFAEDERKSKSEFAEVNGNGHGTDAEQELVPSGE